jgi:hypothetical protein
MMKRLLIFTTFSLFFTTFSHLCMADTLRIYVVGYHFENETFRIFTNTNIYEKKVSKGTNSFAFDIVLPENVKDGQQLDVKIYRKRKLGFIWRDIDVAIMYNNRRKYCILDRGRKVKNKYSFISYWEDFILGIGSSDFWERGEIPEYARCKVIQDPWK